MVSAKRRIIAIGVFSSNAMKVAAICSFIWILAVIMVEVDGKMITCVCTTAYCLSQGLPTCKAKSMCFAQIIHHRGQDPETSPITRGCISGKAPLLCQAKRPRVEYEKWPYLLCCNRNLCNQDLTPTVPSLSLNATTPTPTTTASPSTTAIMKRTNTLSYEDLKAFAENLKPRNSNRPSFDTDMITPINPLSFGVLALGLTLIFCVGGLAVYILKKQSQLAEQLRAIPQLATYDASTVPSTVAFSSNNRLPQQLRRPSGPLPPTTGADGRDLLEESLEPLTQKFRNNNRL